jgi:hypothetical protein
MHRLKTHCPSSHRVVPGSALSLHAILQQFFLLLSWHVLTLLSDAAASNAVSLAVSLRTSLAGTSSSSMAAMRLLSASTCNAVSRLVEEHQRDCKHWPECCAL